MCTHSSRCDWARHLTACMKFWWSDIIAVWFYDQNNLHEKIVDVSVHLPKLLWDIHKPWTTCIMGCFIPCIFIMTGTLFWNPHSIFVVVHLRRWGYCLQSWRMICLLSTTGVILVVGKAHLHCTCWHWASFKLTCHDMQRRLPTNLCPLHMWL